MKIMLIIAAALQSRIHFMDDVANCDSAMTCCD
jgi:hypothetical protein